MTITIPSRLSDHELTAELARCAREERMATAQLVAHLAEFDARRLYLGAGYSSLFAYCRGALGLSEDAAYNRVEAARAGRLFPAILDRLADGSLTVTTVRMLARLLTSENHVELLAAAARRSKREVEELIARRFPKPDTPASVRKVPERIVGDLVHGPVATVARASVASAPVPECGSSSEASLATASPSLSRPLSYRPPVKPLAADRFEFRFTGDTTLRDKLRVVQDLERHAVPDGDVGTLVARAFDALIELRAMRKLAIVRKPQAKPRPMRSGSRHIPARVKRAVWSRDSGRCAFVSGGGHRCAERGFLEYHHVTPFASGGDATVANIQLRCRAHNGYESDLFFRGTAGVRERAAKYAVSREISPVPERVVHGRPVPLKATAARSGPVPGPTSR